MYSSKPKGNQSSVPSDAMAREKLMVYVYEYLKHIGAPQAADTFFKEVRFDKPINLNAEPPGFLFSWWSVFWDLYSSAPERRNLNPHSDEAKAFHDYNFTNGQQNNGQMYMNGMQHNSNAPSPLGMPNDVGIGGPVPGNVNPGGFFPNQHGMRPSQPINQATPQMLQNQPFIPPRYAGVPGPRPPNARMPENFNPPPGQSMMPGNMDPSRQGDGDFVWQAAPPSMQPSNPRMPTGPHPQSRGVPMGGPPGQMGQFSMRPPVNGQPQPNGQQMPINMPGPNQPGRQWGNNNINYNSPSPGNHYGPPQVSSGGPGTPGTIMPSPQGSAPYSPANHRMGTPNTGRGDYLTEVDDIYTYSN